MTLHFELLPSPRPQNAAETPSDLLRTEDAVPSDQQQTNEKDSLGADGHVYFEDGEHKVLHCLPATGVWRADVAPNGKSPGARLRSQIFGSRPAGGLEHVRQIQSSRLSNESMPVFAVGRAKGDVR